MEQEILTQINWLEREQIVELLENVGIACYDNEPTDDLKAALIANIEDGTISACDLLSA